MTDIRNYDFYTTEMGKVMWDKLFFVPHVDATYFVDYGCADGATFQALRQIMPTSMFAGYDIDSKMIDLSLEKHIAGTFFSDSWDEIILDMEHYKKYGRKTCLILSSIIHEIYTYLNDEGIKEFWDRVFNSGFDYIVVRDMAVNYSHWGRNDIADAVMAKGNPKQIKEFEEVWGSVYKHWNAIHFLMKYRYIDNWEREVHEDYFPIGLEYVTGANFINPAKENYKQIMFDHFSVPFIRKQIQSDFGVDMSEPTHYKLIWEKK